MPKVTAVTMKEGQKGPYKSLTFDDGKKANIFAFHSQYDEVTIGGELELIQNGDYWNVVDPAQKSRPRPASGGRSGGVSNAARDASIKAAQERKDTSIAWFNATNAAISLKDVEFTDENKKRITDWRTWFLAQWNDQPPF